uniref:Cell death abnormality protein 1-like n=1 Tax=Crassostrea virginica TaxID=6565 RepID=A0A8B8AJJ8_CRAVI|nr:cell death abnormality protein 1-like [Crassostrea virginica]
MLKRGLHEMKYKGCCAGYFWNVSTERCEACMPGYFGENCSQQCPYPSYGIRCQGGFCDCDEDLCDVSTGCKIRTTDSIYASTDVHNQDNGNYNTIILQGANTVTVKTLPDPQTHMHKHTPPINIL